jgi:hypothetical protein
MTETVSLVPLNEGNDVYLVLDELMTFGRVWRELSEEAANEQTVLELIANGEFRRPTRASYSIRRRAGRATKPSTLGSNV